MVKYHYICHMEIHPKQRKLLNILSKNIEEPLTLEELRERLNLSSRSLVLHHIRQLEKKKFLKRNPSNPRDYKILNHPDELFKYINLYGLAQCGPNGELLTGDPIDRIPISPKMINFDIEDAFMVQAKGNSMKPEIHEDDFIIAKMQNDAEKGDIVVCTLDGEALIKKYYKKDKLLISTNTQYDPIKIKRNSNFKIEGIVKSIICNHN